MEWKFPLPLTHRSKRAARCAAPTEWHGRRVREAAPYGRHGPRRTGGHMGPPLRLKRTALITRAVPLIRHGLRPCHLPLKGKAGGYAVKAFPFRGRCPRRGRMRYPVFRTRHVGPSTPGAVVESHQLQFSKNPGPSGPEEIAESHSDFARRKCFAHPKG